MPITPSGQRLRLYDSDELDCILQAMARQAAALLPPTQAVLIGIQRRGEPLAQRLQRLLSCQTGLPELPLYPLKVKRYADDLKVLHTHTQLTENPLLGALDLAGNTLLIVDDVLFEGHSLLRTCAYLAQLGARRIYTAVLVDRHVCQQPVHADIVGVHLQVAAHDIVECNVPPYEAEFCIDVLRHGVTLDGRSKKRWSERNVMEKMNISKAFTLIESGPVVFVTTNEGEKNNIMTLSWTMVVDFTPIIAITTGPWNYSYAALSKSRACVISIPTVDLIDHVVGIGTCSGADTNKFATFGLTPVKGKHVRAPLIKECVANIECKVIDIVEKYNIVVLEGIAAYFDSSRKEQRTLHAVGDGTFIVDGRRLDRRKMMQSKIPDGV